MRWLAVLLALWAGPAGATAGGPDAFTLRDRAELRMGPGIVFPPLATLAPGTRLTNRGCSPGLFETWCEVETVAGARLRGFVEQRALTEAGRPPPGGGTGPDRVTVTGLRPGDTLNLRSQPSAQSRVVATARAGEALRSLGCEGQGNARWCRVQKLDGSALNGWAAARFLQAAAPPPPVIEDGGPDFYAVRGLPPGNRLGIRAEPAADARLLGTLTEGETVRNLGCQTGGGARWCRIRTTAGADIAGWVNGRYLAEGAAPRPPAVGGGGEGPDTLVVRGLPAGDRLNVRAQPTTQAGIVARLTAGERVANLGCETRGSTRWCRVRTVTGVTGWASARYLGEG